MSAESAGTNQANNCPDPLRLETHNVKQRLRIAIVSLTHTIRSLGFSADGVAWEGRFVGQFSQCLFRVELFSRKPMSRRDRR